MINIDTKVSNPQAILQAWMPFKEIIGVTSVHYEKNYTRANPTIDLLLKEVGDEKGYSLADVLDFLADQVKACEDERYSVPKAEPQDVLRFLKACPNCRILSSKNPTFII